MRHQVRKLLTGFAVIGLCCVLPYAVLFYGPQLWCLATGSDDTARLDQVRRQKERLDAAWDILRQRIEAKDQVIASLIDQRITLFQAAATIARLESAHKEPARYIEHVRWSFPGKSHEERLCRKVIQEVHATLEIDRHQPPTAMVRRLESELETRLRQREPLRLPAPVEPYRSPEYDSD